MTSVADRQDMMRTEVIAPSPASGIQSDAGPSLRRSVPGEDGTDGADGKTFRKDRGDFRDARRPHIPAHSVTAPKTT